MKNVLENDLKNPYDIEELTSDQNLDILLTKLISTKMNPPT